MTLDSFLAQLDGVQPRGSDRWSARCPSHEDKSPSLSIGEGDRGILLRCFAGCTVEEVCRSLGLDVHVLFFDAHDATSHGTTPRPVTPPPARINRKALAFKWGLAALDLRLRAEQILQATKGIAVSDLDDAALDRLINVTAKAYADHDRAGLFEHVADGLMDKHYRSTMMAR
jgi:hypothetical protein